MRKVNNHVIFTQPVIQFRNFKLPLLNYMGKLYLCAMLHAPP